MSDPLNERLNQILPRLVSDKFLTAGGIGNEVPFYIFDYPPEHELRVRDFLRTLVEHLPKHRHGLRVMHLNMFDFLLSYLQKRNYLGKAIQCQREEGNEELKRKLGGILNMSGKLIPYFCELVRPEEYDLVIISGIGSVYPLIRTSSLLSNLQSKMGRTPLVVFYPGKYDQITLRLFGKLRLSADFEDQPSKTRSPERYYRAFKLIP